QPGKQGDNVFRTPLGCGAIGALVLLLSLTDNVRSQSPKLEPPATENEERANLGRSLNFTEQFLARKIDEQLLFQVLADIAVVDKVRYTGPPPRVAKNPTAPGAKNPVIIPAYTFLPKKAAAGQKLPLMVFAHGGVHGNVGTNYLKVFRELLQ